MPRDHRAGATMLHTGGNRTAGASLLSVRQERRSSRVALLIAILLVELSVVAMPAVARVPTRSAAAITETRLRAAPDRGAEPLLRLPEGAIITVHGKAENGWYRARQGPLEGYVLTGDVATEPVTSTTDARSGETPREPDVVALEQRARGRDRVPRSGRNRDEPLRGSGDIVAAV